MLHITSKLVRKFDILIYTLNITLHSSVLLAYIKYIIKLTVFTKSAILIYICTSFWHFPVFTLSISVNQSNTISSKSDAHNGLHITHIHTPVHLAHLGHNSTLAAVMIQEST